MIGIGIGIPMMQYRTATPFVGALDGLVGQGATLLYAGSVRRLLTSWAGDSMRLQGNGTGTPIAAIPFLANGDLDLTAAAAAASAGGGTAAAGETWYDQSGRLDATQATLALRMPFSTVVEAKGGFGNNITAPGTFLGLNLGTVPFPLFVSAAVTSNAVGTASILSSTAGFNRYVGTSSGAMRQSWGTTLAGTATEVSNGKHILGFLGNGAASKHYLDGSLILTGNANTTWADMSLGRIGGQSTNSWLTPAGNSLSEIIVFSSDPTGLAGWSDFVTNQKSYFGVP